MDFVTRTAIDRCIRERIPFIAYILPHESEVHFFANPSDFIKSNMKPDACVSFFGQNAIEIPIYAELTADKVSELVTSKQPQPVIRPFATNTTRQQHFHAVEQIVSRLKHDGGKTVLSRAIVGQQTSDNWSTVIDSVFTESTFAFRFAYYTHATGCWFGASPELLGSLDSSGIFTTMALAGTRTHGEQWDEKNRQENILVVDYIIDAISSAGICPTIADEETVSCGPVEHLRHLISADISKSGLSFSDLIARLSPTPALAGYPLDAALTDIAHFESHPRHCYGGYIAITLPDGSQRAYVNLRSCHINGYAYCLYAGGGITAQSDPAQEWLETEAKASAILSHFHHY